MIRKHKAARSSSRLKPGKLPLTLLNRLLKRYAPRGRDVLVGPAIGVDAAALRFRGGILLSKTDPITFVAEDIGMYSVHINANDIAVMGGTPRWYLACILLPETGATTVLAESIFRDLHRTCRALHISLCGGHTEITAGIDRPIVIGQMLGEVAPKRLITSAGARVGDALIVTKGIAIEAASILARERDEEIRKTFGPRFLERCRGLIRRPGISVLRDAAVALRSGGIHAMHDPTEGGLATGVYELASASRVGILLDAERIPILPEFRRLSEHYGMNPVGAIASGALLIAASPKSVRRIGRGLAQAGIAAYPIGRVTPRHTGIRWEQGGKTRILKPFETDEVARVLGN